MVDICDAYAILNKSVLDVVMSLVQLEPSFEVETRQTPVRLEEATFSVVERYNRLEGSVIVCHDLNQYVNKFYKINLETDSVAWIDYLIERDEVIDLTEFGEYA